MKLLFSILLFITFALRPAMEISTVLYYQLNIDYIIENYCINKERPSLKCDGKCYLTKQMQSISTSSDSNENKESSALIESFIPLYYENIQIIISSTPFFEKSIQNWATQFWNSYEHQSRIEQPPIS